MSAEQETLGHPESDNRRRLRLLCSVCLHDTGTDGAGVVALSAAGTAVNLMATDTVSAALDDLQVLLGEGPCLTATSTNRPVLVPDLSHFAGEPRPRWPVYSGAASRAGAGAVFAFPILLGDIALGRVDLYRRLPGALSGAQLRSGIRAATDIGWQLLELTDAELTGPPSPPFTLHQAAGMVMVQLGTSIDVALSRLRAWAFADGLTMGELADSVLSGDRAFAAEEG